ncbi:recombinase RecT [Rhizobium lusitanum]|uniref:recombinase RecT n=1 Tax=Rhizobium lusitanum TaxID=293958 RepID=UPI00195C2B84|nr:recombinase RecT [Rhizobium lusitanum]MBM7046092.1 recombinase RecT [Rhizobium lusitanum]
MNQVTKLGEQVALTSSEGGFAVTPQTLNDVVEFAKFMCQSNAGIPSYLRGNGPDCAAIIMQALKWGFDPFSVAQKSYKVKDVLAYEAQLIAAVINARSGIKGRLKYQFEGTGEDLVCTVTGMLDGDECIYTSPRVGNITTKNSPLWKTDPQQQLGYYSSRNWARRHCPEVILGAYDRDEAEEFRGADNAKDITPQPTVMERLRAQQETTQQPQGRQEGFDVSFVHSETESALTGEILDNDSTNSGSSPEPEPADATPSPASAEAGDTVPLSPASQTLDDDLRTHLMDFARKALRTAEDDLPSAKKLDLIEDMLANYREVIPEQEWGKLSTIKVSIQAVLAGKRTIDQARKFITGDLLGCDASEIGGVS